MKVAYLFDENVGNYHYGRLHPMKPHRSAVVNSLLHSYGLDKHMDILKTKKESKDTYHSEEISLNETVFNDDCPYFVGIEDYCAEYTSNSLTAAASLLEYDIAINWSGGMHHGKKHEPSGFCYKNDIVVAIQRLLKYFNKVLYIDIDIHHGDAVEEAFGFSERVLTCSFHKYGDNFFPGTGSLLSNHFSNENLTKFCDSPIDNFYKLKDLTNQRNELKFSDLHYEKPFKEKSKIKNVINVPLRNGIDDWSYKYIFEPVVEHIMKKFDPTVIVMQCGADSLGEDRLGSFNLTVQGHGACLDFVKSYNKKLMVLGGGGYTLHNVARAWTYETSILTNTEIPSIIPDGPYLEYFAPSYNLFPDLKRRFENDNTKNYLDSISTYVHNILERF